MVDRATLEAAVAAYNEYRQPMATATVLDHSAPGFTVRFDGPFCRMCCDYDYFEDLVYELVELGTAAATVDIEDVAYAGDETFVVEYATR